MSMEMNLTQAQSRELIQIMVLAKMGLIRGPKDLSDSQRATMKLAYDQVKALAVEQGETGFIEMAKALGFEDGALDPASEPEIKPYR